MSDEKQSATIIDSWGGLDCIMSDEEQVLQ